MPNKSSLFPINLKVGLLAGSSALASVGTSSSLLLDTHKDNLKTITDSAGSAISPIVDPIKSGVTGLTKQLDDFSKQGYNFGLDAAGWVKDNFNKSKIKNGGDQIYQNLKSWYETVKSAASSAGNWIKDFFEKWDDSKESMHQIFKSLGNTFSLLGSLVGSGAEGERTIKVLFEAMGKPEFKDFMSSVSTLVSKNPSLVSELEMKDVNDILFAFRQEPITVNGILKELNEKNGDSKVDRNVLLSALKLQSLIGKAESLGKRAKELLSSGSAEERKKVIKELQEIIKSLEETIKANEAK